MKLEEMNIEQLRALNKRVVAMIGAKSAALAQTFVVGERVWFDAKTRGIVQGKVESIGPKNVKVRSTTGTKWTVTSTMLQRGTP